MLPVKDVTEAILALRRRAYSSHLVTLRTGVLLPAHPLQAGHPRPPAGGTGPGPLWLGDPAWLHTGASHGVDELMREATRGQFWSCPLGGHHC